MVIYEDYRQIAQIDCRTSSVTLQRPSRVESDVATPPPLLHVNHCPRQSSSTVKHRICLFALVSELLINADWDPATQIMSSYAKGRGPGDCGNSTSYLWDGEQFRLLSAQGMEQCRGSLDWQTLWQAEAKLVD